MAKKFKEAQARLFTNMFVCRKCKTKTRTTAMRIKLGKVKCRKCGRVAFRPKKKERKVG